MTHRLRIHMVIAVLAVAAAVVAIRPAGAGTVITSELQGPGMIAPVIETTYLDERFIRFDSGRHVSIYDATTDLRVEFNTEKKTYFEATTRQLSDFVANALTFRRQMMAQLARLAPRDRLDVEFLLLMRNADVGAPLDINFSSLARTETVGKWRCRLFALQVDGVKRAEQCVVPLREVGLAQRDLRATAAMARTAAALANTGSGYARYTAAGDPGLLNSAVGFPALAVRTVHFRDGQPSITATVLTVERRELPPATFVGPSGHTREPLPALRDRKRAG